MSLIFLLKEGKWFCSGAYLGREGWGREVRPPLGAESKERQNEYVKETMTFNSISLREGSVNVERLCQNQSTYGCECMLSGKMVTRHIIHTDICYSHIQVSV